MWNAPLVSECVMPLFCVKMRERLALKYTYYVVEGCDGEVDAYSDRPAAVEVAKVRGKSVNAVNAIQWRCLSYMHLLVHNYLSIRKAEAAEVLPVTSLHTGTTVEWDHESDLTLPGLWHSTTGHILIPDRLQTGKSIACDGHIFPIRSLAIHILLCSVRKMVFENIVIGKYFPLQFSRNLIQSRSSLAQ